MITDILLVVIPSLMCFISYFKSVGSGHTLVMSHTASAAIGFVMLVVSLLMK